MTISAARADDLTSLVEIERAAGETFRSLGMDLVADDERLGFRYLDREEETPGLRDIRQHERAAGLDAWPRACMRRSLTPDSLS